jgi:hypothetical protein
MTSRASGEERRSTLKKTTQSCLPSSPHSPHMAIQLELQMPARETLFPHDLFCKQRRGQSIFAEDIFNRNRVHTSPSSELQLEPQQIREQTPPPHDLDSKHDGGECSQPEEISPSLNSESTHLMLSVDLSSSCQ